MTHEPLRIDFDQFLADPQQVFELVRRRGEPILVERDGETHRLEQELPRGPWNDTDVDKLMADLRGRRGQNSGGRRA